MTRILIGSISSALLLALPSLASGAVLPKEVESGTVYASGAIDTPHLLQQAVPPQVAHAWARFVSAEGPGWHASFDATTGVPARIYGGKIEVPGSITSARIAERAARTLLGQHLELLAPGATIEELVLSANDLSDGLRTVAFVQTHQGLTVEGAQLSFRFKNQRLFMIASEAWPMVSSSAPTMSLTQKEAEPRALGLIRSTTGIAGKPVGFSGPSILPIPPQDGLRASDRVVVQVRVRSEHPNALWAVYLDARTGEPVARRQLLMFTTGTLQMNAPVRWPGGGRQDFGASGATVELDGQPTTADLQGVLSWASAGPVTTVAHVEGPLVKVINAAGTATTASFMLQPGGSAIWNAAANELVDAQLTTFIASQKVKAFTRVIAPQMTWLASNQLQANVNINDVCNAFSDGESTNFFQSGMGCENTGRIPDVIYHEFGHAFHNHAVIPGAGRFETNLSEGASDFLAASITGDHGMGRGFFFNDMPLRDLDPAGIDLKWPEDVARDPHETGLIFGGAMWDLRTLLITALGEQAGIEHTLKLYYGVLQRARDIPTSYAEVLAGDDDDGDLSNGTPNVCLINDAFGRHGLLDLMNAGPGIGTPLVNGPDIAVPVHRRDNCSGSEVTQVVVRWMIRGEPNSGGTINLGTSAEGFAGSLPVTRKGVVLRYKIEVTVSSGKTVSFPNNPADPMYETYVGEVVPIYCNDFESAADGWTHHALATNTATNADDWQLGMPSAPSSSSDPASAHSGTQCWGNDLGLPPNVDGQYAANAKNGLTSPSIDVSQFKEVRLQYWRWLTVEDGIGDQARITSGDTLLWSNYASKSATVSPKHHIDREWRFQDVDLTPVIQNGSVQVSYELITNRRRRYGGWTLDDFCVVGVSSRCGNGTVEAGEACDDGNNLDGDGCQSDCTWPAPVCGNGKLEAGEACDDGNTRNGDGCESNCTKTVVAACGNGVVDPGEACDDGVLDGTSCAPGCVLPSLPPAAKSGCGCQSTGEPADGRPLVLLLAVGLLLLRRRPSGATRPELL